MHISKLIIFYTYQLLIDSRDKPRKEESKSKEPESKSKDGKTKYIESKEDVDKDKDVAKAEGIDTKPEEPEATETKQEKKDDLLAADHKPDIPGDEKVEKDIEKDSVTVKNEKDKERSPRRSRSKSNDRSR